MSESLAMPGSSSTPARPVLPQMNWRNVDPSGIGFAVVVVGTAAVVGVLAGIDWRMGIAAAVGIALLLATMQNLLAGLTGFVFLSFLELVPSLTGPTLSLSKVAGGVLVLTWLATASRSEVRRQEFFSAYPVMTGLLAVFVLWTGLSVIWAEDPSQVFTPVASWALNFALFPLVYAAIRKPSDMRPLIMAFVLGAGTAAVYGVLAQPNAAAQVTSPTAAQGLDRLAGTIGDPNSLATLLAAGIGLSAALIFNSKISPPWRWGIFGLDLLMLTAIFITLSRGGLIALSAALIAGVFATASRHRAGAFGALVLVIVIGYGFFFGVASPEARDRVMEADGGSGRTDIWKIGWRMVQDEPIIGQGAGNFQVSSIHYLLAPGSIKRDEFIVDQPATTHNSYLQVLAELGIVGITLFALILIGGVIAAAQAISLFRKLDDEEGALMAASVLVAIGALLAGYFFLSEQYSKHLWLMLAFAPALLGVARRNQAALREGSA